MMQKRNIILIGRTGNGKSTLANVIGHTNRFKESDFGVSETSNMQIEDVDGDGIIYRIIDTVGIGDTSLSQQEVLNKIAEAVHAVKDGLSQILFVTSGRFTEEEVEAYDLLKSVVFDKNIVRYTTIVRTKFPGFRKPERCDEDKEAIIEENEKLREVILSCNKFIHVNNPPIADVEVEERKVNLRARENSRSILLAHLYTCQGIYKPANLDKLNDRINNHMNQADDLQNQLDEMRRKLSEWTSEHGESSDEYREFNDNTGNIEMMIANVKRELAEIMKKFVLEAYEGLNGFIKCPYL